MSSRIPNNSFPGFGEESSEGTAMSKLKPESSVVQALNISMFILEKRGENSRVNRFE